MKYGKEIVRLANTHPRCKNFYISYKELKRAIKEMKTDAQSLASQPSRNQVSASSRKSGIVKTRLTPIADKEEQFKALLRHQLDKINNYVELQFEVLSRELSTRLRTAAVDDIAPLDRLAGQIIELDVFVRANFTGFRKICKKCDKQHDTGFSSWFMPCVESAPFRQWDLDILLQQLGKLYALWRQKIGPAGIMAAGGPDPTPATSSSAAYEETFFVPPEMVVSAKVALLKWLHTGTPERLGSERPDGKAPARELWKPAGLTKHLQESLGFVQQVSHVYFDNQQGAQYAERYRRCTRSQPDAVKDSEAAVKTTFCCRWVGENKGENDVDIYIDAEDVSGTKVEVSLKQKHMKALSKGELEIKDALKDASAAGGSKQIQQVLNDVKTAIVVEQLRPVVSSSFRRYLFVGDEAASDEGSAAAVATIDEELAFLDETSSRDMGSWCRAAMADKKLPAEGLAVIPYAVLRVRTPSKPKGGIREWFQWPPGLLTQQLPGFSKVMHGMALLHRELAVPVPPWLPALNDKSNAGQSNREDMEQSAINASLDTVNAASPPDTSGTPAPAAPVPGKEGSAKPQKKAAKPAQAEEKLLRVDVKTPLANERTLLRWLRVAVMMSTLSAWLSSKNDDASIINGLLLMGVTVLFVYLPLSSYRSRSLQFENPKAIQPESDRVQPQLLAMSLIILLVAMLIIQAMFSDSGQDPDQSGNVTANV